MLSPWFEYQDEKRMAYWRVTSCLRRWLQRRRLQKRTLAQLQQRWKPRPQSCARRRPRRVQLLQLRKPRQTLPGRRYTTALMAHSFVSACFCSALVQARAQCRRKVSTVPCMQYTSRTPIVLYQL